MIDESLKEYIDRHTDRYRNLSEDEILSLSSLYLNNLRIEYIHEGLSQFKKYIDLSDNLIKVIPKGFIQNGEVNLSANLIDKISEGFKQRNELDLSYNNIKNIPDNFYGGYFLNLRGNRIENFPRNIIQSDEIDLGENFIKIIPKECDIKGYCLFLDGNPIIDIEIGAKLSVNLIREITSLDSYLNYQNRKNNKQIFMENLK